MLGTGYQNKKM